MENEKLDLQGAVDRAGDMCRTAMDKYIETKAQFPSYGPKLDRQVAAFLQGLESWMSGSLEWSFVTPRYLGKKRQEIKKTRRVKLLRRRAMPANAA